jgi:hypothetical protein
VTERSLAELAGHDLDAQRQLVVLLARYRREGVSGLRATVEQATFAAEGMPRAQEFRTVALIVEAVLTIAELRSRPATSARRAWEDFDREEERAEAEREDRGGA